MNSFMNAKILRDKQTRWDEAAFRLLFNVITGIW